MLSSTPIAKTESVPDRQDRLLRALQVHLRSAGKFSPKDRDGTVVVAYHGEKQIAVASSADEAFRECDRLGLPRAEIVLATVTYPDDEEELEDCLGLYEFDEMES